MVRPIGVNLRESPDGNPGRRKRVKFADKVTNFNISFQSSHAMDSSSEGPKTSEYKSFKKLIEELAGKVHSEQHHETVDKLKDHENGVFPGEVKNDTASKCEMLKTSLPVIDATPLTQMKPILPRGVLKDPPDMPCSGGIFSRARHSVIKLAAEVLSLKVDEFIKKGPFLIPELLCRLGIGNKVSNSGSDSERVHRQQDELTKPQCGDQLLGTIYSKVRGRELSNTLTNKSAAVHSFCNFDFYPLNSGDENAVGFGYPICFAQNAGIIKASSVTCENLDLLCKCDSEFDHHADFVGHLLKDSHHNDSDSKKHDDFHVWNHWVEEPVLPFKITPPQGYFKEKAMVPYEIERFSERNEFCIQNAQPEFARPDCCNLQLLDRDRNDTALRPKFFEKCEAVFEKKNQLPLTLCNFSKRSSLQEGWKLADIFVGETTSEDSPLDEFATVLFDKAHAIPAAAALPSESNFMLPLRRLPSYPRFRFPRTTAEETYDCLYDGMMPNAFSVNGCKASSLSSIGLEISTEDNGMTHAIIPGDWCDSDVRNFW